MHCNMATATKQVLSRLMALPLRRAFSTTPKARSAGVSWQQRGIVGSNVPFRIDNKYRLTVVFTLFFGSAYNLPFLVIYRQMTK